MIYQRVGATSCLLFYRLIPQQQVVYAASARLNKINTFLEGVYTQPIKTQIDFAKQFRGNDNLIEGLDYTMQSGYMVFSKWFFLKRGSCCKNGCKNCPYSFKKSKVV